MCGFELKANEGDTERMVRALLSGAFLLGGFFLLEGILRTVAYVLSAVLAITAITGFCGLYAIMGISTCPVPKKPAVLEEKAKRKLPARAKAKRK